MVSMNLKTIIKNILFEDHMPGTAIFVGRMQPLTIAHYNIINDARKKYNELFVVIVAGKSKKNNPFTFKQRVELVHKAFEGKIPMSHIIKAPTGFTPNILMHLQKYISRHAHKRLFILFAGEDRAEEYRNQIKKYYKGDAQVELHIIPRDDDSVSATKVRKALVDGDIENYKRLMPRTLWGEYEKLKKIIASIGNQLTDNKIIKTS